MFSAACIGDLHALTSLVEQACREVDADEGTLFSLRLAVEEVFTNILDYGYKDGTGPVSIRIEPQPGQIRVSFADSAPRFDPATVPTPRLDVSLEERQVGGWGWHFVREAVDRVEWEPREQGGNLLTLVKYLPSGSTSQQGSTIDED
ncbi:MAG: ATP-binding protein [Rhodanobacter sp.]